MIDVLLIESALWKLMEAIYNILYTENTLFIIAATTGKLGLVEM